MLSFFRRALSSWAVIGLLGLLMVAFIVTGVGTPSSMGALGGVGDNDVARVGNRSLSVNDVSQRMQLELQQVRQERPEVTMPEFMKGGVLDQMIAQLTDLLTVRAFGEEHGMVVSDRLGDAEIASISAFKGATGKFDDARYRQALSERGLTEEQFRADVDQSIAIRHLLVPVTASAGAPRDLALTYASLLVERRVGTVLTFPNSAFANGPAPSDAALKAFYDANRARYTVPEQRVLRYALVDKALVAKTAAPSDAEIAAQYKKDETKYAARELRDLTQVIVQDQKAAQAIAQKARAGMSLADAAKSAGADAIAIKGTEKAAFAKQSADPVAAAAFAAAKGGIAGPAKSAFGWHVLRVDNVTMIGGKSLTQVRAEIAKTLAEQKSADAFADLLAQIDEDVANGQTFDDVAKARGLTIVTTPALTASGTSLAQPGYRLDATFAPVLKDAFQAEENDDPALVALGPDKDVFYDLDRIVKAAPRPLADIRAQVAADFVADRAAKAARKAAEAALGKANAGAALAALGGTPRPLSARRADVLRQGIAPTAELQLLFDLNAGKARIARSSDGQGWILVKLDRIEPGNLAEDPSLIAATQAQLSNAVGEEYTRQFTTAIKAELPVKRNSTAIEALRKSLSGSGSAAR